MKSLVVQQWLRWNSRLNWNRSFRRRFANWLHSVRQSSSSAASRRSTATTKSAAEDLLFFSKKIEIFFSFATERRKNDECLQNMCVLLTADAECTQCATAIAFYVWQKHWSSFVAVQNKKRKRTSGESTHLVKHCHHRRHRLHCWYRHLRQWWMLPPSNSIQSNRYWWKTIPLHLNWWYCYYWLPCCCYCCWSDEWLPFQHYYYSVFDYCCCWRHWLTVCCWLLWLPSVHWTSAPIWLWLWLHFAQVKCIHRMLWSVSLVYNRRIYHFHWYSLSHFGHCNRCHRSISVCGDGAGGGVDHHEMHLS